MQFFAFHLMPYADLDLDYDKTYNSAWVTLPNSYYDPVKGHRLYNRYIDELIYADELGFDGIGVNEHHQNAYGLMPIPGVIAGALARQTRRAKIAVLGRALPLVNNPLTIGEEFAMLDNISGGRLIAGFVRGIGAEYHASGVNPAESHERYQEAHDLIIRAWTEPGPFPHDGKHYHFKYVNTWPRPYQKPHPPVWIPSQGSRETIEWASHPSRKYTYLQTFSPVDALARFMGLYREQAAKYGYTATPQQLGWAVPIYVADSDDVAQREAKPHIENFFNKFARMPPEMLLPPGYLSLQSMQGLIAKSKASLTSGVYQTIDDLMRKGMFLCGSADTICDLLTTYQQKIGFGHLICMLQFGTLPADLTRRNLELFARKVMPRVRHLGETAIAGAAE
jgi:alkanesulfonate monooxygenase SsuD/methylene tetrahydromethanopterin reductase-like flavin-dependent oxidoreductase (luciferase family)